MLSPSSLSHCSILSRILVTESEIDVMRNVPSKDKNQRSTFSALIRLLVMISYF